MLVLCLRIIIIIIVLAIDQVDNASGPIAADTLNVPGADDVDGIDDVDIDGGDVSNSRRNSRRMSLAVLSALQKSKRRPSDAVVGTNCLRYCCSYPRPVNSPSLWTTYSSADI